jgi:hypothetical protein
MRSREPSGEVRELAARCRCKVRQPSAAVQCIAWASVLCSLAAACSVREVRFEQSDASSGTKMSASETPGDPPRTDAGHDAGRDGGDKDTEPKDDSATKTAGRDAPPDVPRGGADGKAGSAGKDSPAADSGGAGGAPSVAGMGADGEAGEGGTPGSAGAGGVPGAPEAGSGGTEPEAGSGGTEPEAGSGGTEPEAGSGGTEPEAGSDSQPPRDCIVWVPADIKAGPVPENALAGGQETVVGEDIFTHYVCRGPLNSAGDKHVGKGSFRFGCFIPTDTDPSQEVTAMQNVDILTTVGSPRCVAWVSAGDDVPLDRAVEQAGEYICRVRDYVGTSNFENEPQSSGSHVGQLRQQSGGGYRCDFGFYGNVQSESDPLRFDVLLYQR